MIPWLPAMENRDRQRLVKSLQDDISLLYAQDRRKESGFEKFQTSDNLKAGVKTVKSEEIRKRMEESRKNAEMSLEEFREVVRKKKEQKQRQQEQNESNE